MAGVKRDLFEQDDDAFAARRERRRRSAPPEDHRPYAPKAYPAADVAGRDAAKSAGFGLPYGGAPESAPPVFPPPLRTAPGIAVPPMAPRAVNWRDEVPPPDPWVARTPLPPAPAVVPGPPPWAGSTHARPPAPAGWGRAVRPAPEGLDPAAAAVSKRALIEAMAAAIGLARMADEDDIALMRRVTARMGER